MREVLTEKEVLKIFRDKGALLTGHFELTSGLHSVKYLQCAIVLQYPELAALLCGELAGRFGKESGKVDLVISPAIGGIVVGQEVARALKARAIFCERQGGKMCLRRGFRIARGQRVLVVEDVITTGGSVMEVIDLAREAGGEVVGIGALVDRSSQEIDFGVKKVTLLTLDISNYRPPRCPLCKKGVPLVKPGSRGRGTRIAK